MTNTTTRFLGLIACAALVTGAAASLAGPQDGRDTRTSAMFQRDPGARITLRQFEARWSGSGLSARADAAMSRPAAIDVASR